MKKLKELDVKTVRIGVAGLVVVVVIVVLAISLLGGSDSDSSSTQSSETVAALSESQLVARGRNLGHPVYWVGPRPESERYEFTSTADGKVYVRYLTGEAEAGDPRPDFLTVGTYEVPDAKAALRKAKAEGANMTLKSYDGYEVLDEASASNAYVVFDEQPELQVEIYSPNPGEAHSLAKSGALEPVE